MKIAARALKVYGAGGKTVIGELACGDAVHVMSSGEQGVQIAYITGLIKPEDAKALLTTAQFEKKVSRRERLQSFAAAQQGRATGRADNGAGLIAACLEAAGLPSGNACLKSIWQNACKPIGKAALNAGDIVFAQRSGAFRRAGIWMGDNTVITAGRGGVVRRPFRAWRWNRFGRLLGVEDKGGGA